MRSGMYGHFRGRRICLLGSRRPSSATNTTEMRGYSFSVSQILHSISVHTQRHSHWGSHLRKPVELKIKRSCTENLGQPGKASQESPRKGEEHSSDPERSPVFSERKIQYPRYLQLNNASSRGAKPRLTVQRMRVNM